MNLMNQRAILLLSTLCMANLALAELNAFVAGPVISEFGRIAKVDSDMLLPEDTVFRVVFDVSEKAETGRINRTVGSAARFINMHVAAGVPARNIRLALVFHGGASVDVTTNPFFARKNAGQENMTATALATLLRHPVDVYLCGQSAAAHGIDNDDLLPGIKMALSAMTAHALLQQDGYTLNPF